MDTNLHRGDFGLPTLDRILGRQQQAHDNQDGNESFGPAHPSSGPPYGSRLPRFGFGGINHRLLARLVVP
ncbi:MAG: hypothetical protein Rhob2KO_03410 [Rhodopirellula baltica]